MRSGFVVFALVMACRDDSGVARKVAAAPGSAKSMAPEPPGGPPSCDEVAAHLAAGLDVPSKIRKRVEGAEIEVAGDPMRSGARQAFGNACREAAWSQAARACAVAWNGDLLRERAKFSQACPEAAL